MNKARHVREGAGGGGVVATAASRWLLLAAAGVALGAAAPGCSGSDSGQQGAQAGGGATATTAGPRARPRRRTVRRVLSESAARAAACLPPSVPHVTVSGTFVGQTGAYQVDQVASEQPLSQEARRCVREEFETAHVEPFTEERFESGWEVLREGAEGADGGVAAGAGIGAMAGFAPGAGGDAGAAGTATGGSESHAGGAGTAGAGATTATAGGGTAGTAGATTTAGGGTAAGATPTTSGSGASAAGTSAGGATAGAGAGPLDAEQIITCYRTASHTDPLLGGRIRLRFTVNADGAVSAVSARQVGNMRGQPPVFTQTMRCIEQRVRQLNLASAGAGAFDLTLTLSQAPRTGQHIAIERSATGALVGALSGGGGATEPHAGGGDAHAGGGGNAAGAGNAASGNAAGAGGNAAGAGATATTAGAAGALDMAQVANVVRARTGDIRGCYQTQLGRDPTLQLSLRVRFNIDPVGTVSSASSRTVVNAGNPDAADEVARCVEGVVRGTTFPSHGGAAPVEATLPFTFTPTGASATASSGGGGGGGASPTSTGPATGRIDPVRVSAVIRSRTPLLRECYTRALANDPQLAGRVMVRFTVEPTGRVVAVNSQPQVRAGSPAQFAEVAHCIEGIMQVLTLPPPMGGAAAVALPFDFGPTP